MVAFIPFVESLVYGNALAPAQNHGDWTIAKPSPTGTQWLAHHLDRMLPAFESWLVAGQLPPLTAWDGQFPTPWDPTNTVPLTGGLNGTWTGIATLDDLGAALAARLKAVALDAPELIGKRKAPFSYRFWGYLRWAWTIRERFLGRQVMPVGTVVDRDGTQLSAVSFTDVFNDLHRNWHISPNAPVAPTPGFRTTVGQRVRLGIVSARGEDFLRFHREHMNLFHRWLDRTGQAHLLPVDMGGPGGWPESGPNVPPSPYAANENAVSPGSPLQGQTSINQIGDIEFGYHVTGHGQNTDIGPLSHNNYVPRFHNWHGWIDAQWWWREPRFVRSDPTTGERERFFRVVLQNGADLPGLPALSIVRDPAVAADQVYPATAVGGLNLTTGAGSLRMRLYVRDPFDRTLRMRLIAEVLDFNGAVGETVTVLRTIGTGGDHPLDTEFLETISFASAFASDDPTMVNAAVGFLAARIRITGNLWVPNTATPDDPTTSHDPGFVHEDVTYIDLVREKQAPDVTLYLNRSSFSRDQVNATLGGGPTASFPHSFLVAVQDRTSPAQATPAWPAAVADEVKGLLVGLQPSAGLFDDPAHQPTVELFDPATSAVVPGVTVVLAGPPDKEDPTLPPEVPQRYTWRYSVVFDASGAAFDDLATGTQREVLLRVRTGDRAGNAVSAQASVRLFVDANPYMLDGNVPWLSIDTRVFNVLEGQTRLGETYTAGRDPLDLLTGYLNRLNTGTTGGQTFGDLPTEGVAAALEYAPQVPNPQTGVATPVRNFALARVRIATQAGAKGVRLFFRLFRYAAPSLLFDTARGYRSFADGLGRVIPLVGFESQTNGAALTSIPFFGSPRLMLSASPMTDQTDPTNVHEFGGAAGEQVWYFGAWLDVNVPSVQIPEVYVAANPDGPFTAGQMRSICTLMTDFHQCLVAEICFDADPTTALASPFESDNLAQRNLVVLESDNPGDVWTRTVEHSFEIDLHRPALGPDIDQSDDENVAVDHGVDHGEPCRGCGDHDVDDDLLCAHCAGLGARVPLLPDDPRQVISTFQFQKLLLDQAMDLAFRDPEGMRLMFEHGHHAVLERFGRRAAALVSARHPFVAHPTRWAQTTRMLDELEIRWHDLPAGSTAELFLPGMDVSEILSLRNVRHAPATVWAVAPSALGLAVGGTTYLPIPPPRGERQAAVLTVRLPSGVKAGTSYTVDVAHLRAGSAVANGAFQVQIVVGHAEALLPRAERGLTLLHERRNTLRPGDRWLPVLERRVDTERRRAIGLAAELGLPWTDPTTWTDPDGNAHPVLGERVRIVLEEITILDDRDPWLKGAGEIDLDVLVYSADNGGQQRHLRLPEHGHLPASSGGTLPLEIEIFDGIVHDHLALRIGVMERDTLDPDDNLGVYTRIFRCGPAGWLGAYRPGQELPIDPQTLGYWQLAYRIERG
ncbi:MAG TPA: hypothetical protein VFZ32_21145 [Micromonosporaceae bacterium]